MRVPLKAVGVPCLLTVVFPVISVRAQQYDPKLYSEMRWRCIGPFRGGRTVAISGVPQQPNVFYMAAVNGGVWKTTDFGNTWFPIFDDEASGSVGALAVAPSDPNILYVGSGEGLQRPDLAVGDGVYKSIDAGKTWTHLGLRDAQQITAIVVDPRNPDRVFVSIQGHAYGPNVERGIFRSIDGGKTFEKVLYKDENTGGADVVMDPSNPQVLFAALWAARVAPWEIRSGESFVIPGSGLYKSTDGGSTWRQIAKGLPGADDLFGRIGIAIAPSNPKRMYLTAEAQKEPGIYRSDDGGESWQHVNEDHRIGGRGPGEMGIAVSPDNADLLYVANTTTWKSTDGGKTFTGFKGAPGGDDYQRIWINPNNAQTIALSSDQGAVISVNGGQTWSSWYSQPTAQFYHVTTDNRFPYWVYGAQQDSGSAATPSRSKYRSLNFHDWRPMEAGDENGYIAPDPLNPGVVFGGFVARQDFGDEQVQQMPPTLAHQGHYRRTWTLPLVFSPIDAHVLYFGSQVLFRTGDGGNSWQVISPDLTREDPGVPPNLDAATAADAPKGKRHGVIYTIGPSFVRAGEIWAGTDDGLIRLTLDEGKTWENVTPPELTPWSKVTHIEASHSDAGTAYAAVDRHRLEDYQAYLYRTRDFGKTWQRVSNGIPEGSFLNCVREDPARKGLLYACTEKGVYVSFNDGDDWQSLQLNLPVTSVRDLVVHENDLVVATFGRSFWILDDVTPLRQMDAHVAAADAWLFRPQTAIRTLAGSDQGTPVPMDESLAANSPEGAMLDYFLKDKPSTPIQLEIFDSEGKLVRRFASDDVLQKTNPNDVAIQVEWIRDPKPLLAEAGMQRFVWDLRYAAPKVVRRSARGPGGPLAVPGSYTVKLTANGKSSTQTLTMKLDARVKTPQDALVRQFELASKLTSRLGEVSLALQQAGELRKQLDERKKEAGGNTELMTALQGLEKKLGAEVETDRDAEFGLFGIAAPGKEHEPLRHVAAALTGLLFIVDGSDLGPTTDAATSSERWNEAAQETLARWAAFQKDELENANALLRKTKLKTLSVE